MRIRIAVVTTALLLTLVPATAASAAPTVGIPPRTGGGDVAALLEGRIAVAKADGLAFMPRQTLRVYAYESSAHHGDTTVDRSRAWIVRKPGAAPTFGVFAPVTVQSHAGRRAVVVTISQQQTVDSASNTYLPLSLVTRVAGSGQSTTTVRGSTVLHVDSLTVDGTAVDVGSTCATSSALAITLVGGPGWSDLQGGVLQGTFAIPRFSGCDGVVAGTSATVSAALSGGGNSVILARGAAGIWDTTAPHDCRSCGQPPLLP